MSLQVYNEKSSTPTTFFLELEILESSKTQEQCLPNTLRTKNRIIYLFTKSLDTPIMSKY